MKHTYLILGICIGCLFTACKPDFDLNATYQDVTVVYGILNYQDSIHYVKIYKGFQSHVQGGVYIDAQNPDSIYYYDKIDVVLQEYNNGKPTQRPNIPLYITHDFPRDVGIFYYDKEKILYYTKEEIKKGYSYKIKITNRITGKVTEGMAPVISDFHIIAPYQINMASPIIRLRFEKAPAASDSCYEFLTRLHYFEVNRTNKEVTRGSIEKIITNVGEYYEEDKEGYFNKTFSATFYEDLATKLKPNSGVIRYLGFPEGGPDDTQAPIHIDGWAAGTSMKNYMLSNKPSSSFVQVNTYYTNMEVTAGEGLAYGFFSSIVQSPRQECILKNPISEDSLVLGSITRHLGFRYRHEYRP